MHFVVDAGILRKQLVLQIVFVVPTLVSNSYVQAMDQVNDVFEDIVVLIRTYKVGIQIQIFLEIKGMKEEVIVQVYCINLDIIVHIVNKIFHSTAIMMHIYVFKVAIDEEVVAKDSQKIWEILTVIDDLIGRIIDDDELQKDFQSITWVDWELIIKISEVYLVLVVNDCIDDALVIENKKVILHSWPQVLDVEPIEEDN